MERRWNHFAKCRTFFTWTDDPQTVLMTNPYRITEMKIFYWDNVSYRDDSKLNGKEVNPKNLLNSIFTRTRLAAVKPIVREIEHDGKWCGTTKGKWHFSSHSSPLHPVCFPITQSYTGGATSFPWKVLTMELDNFCPGTCQCEFRGKHWNQQQLNLPHSQGTVVWFLRWWIWNGAGTLPPTPILCLSFVCGKL